MCKLFRPPKVHVENRSQAADFVELECLRRADGNVSATDLMRTIARVGTDSDDRDSDDSQVEQFVDSVFGELADRVRHCGAEDGRYPYRLEGADRLLQFDPRSDIRRAELYLFLLLATRMNMRSERSQAGIDATALFESVCVDVAKRYWGDETTGVQAVVFGTGRLVQDHQDDDPVDTTVFGSEVNKLCAALGEGRGFDPKVERVKARDGRLDLVVWRPFTDSRQGQLVGFGQCKTGTSWRSYLTALRPDDFFAKWARSQPAVTPVRLFFVAERVIDRWYEHSRDGGLLFDRCRIVELSDRISDDNAAGVRDWVQAALSLKGCAIE